jgi:transposase
MRTRGTDNDVLRRQRSGLALLTAGLTVKQVARRMRTTERTIYRWKAIGLSGANTQVHKVSVESDLRGRPSRLTQEQLVQLACELKRGALAQGYEEDYWTLERIGALIWSLFKVRYQPSGVWHVMQRIGWSSQLPQRVSSQRDDEQIAHWKRYIWPRIKKVA